MKGVYFGDKHSFNDFHMVLNSRNIPLPVPKTHYVPIPGTDGSLDLSTALTGGKVKYENREITMNFTLLEPAAEWDNSRSTLSNYLHGKVMNVRFEADPDWFYTGRCRIDSFTTKKGAATVTIKMLAEPYKYDVLDSLERIKWQLYGSDKVIHCSLKNLTVTGNLTIKVPPQQMDVVPTIITSADMQLKYGAKQYGLFTGDNVIADVVLSSGINMLTFIGSGTVSIKFRGGAL